MERTSQTAVVSYTPGKGRKLNPDPRSKLVFLGVISTLEFFGHDSILFLSVLALIPIILLLSARQYKTVSTDGLLWAVTVALTFTPFYKTYGVLRTFIGLLVWIILRFFPGLLLGYYFITSTTADEFVSAMHLWHVSDKFNIPVSVMFRLFPTIKNESRAIASAMKMREIYLGGRQLQKDPGSWIEYRMVPLLMSIVIIGEELSAAALTKGLGKYPTRTNIMLLKFGFPDFVLLLLSTVLITWVVLL